MTYLGIDIGGTKIKAGLVTAEGEIIRSKAVSTPTRDDIFKEAIRTVIEELVADCGLLRGVGIGCKGVINPQTTEVEILPGDFQFLEGQRLSAIVRPALLNDALVSADNDARVALAGEVAWGAAAGKRNVVMLTLGTGVGGGVVADGKILRGERGVAGHLGHMTIESDGLTCFCGNRGCLETIFSARAIEAAALHAIHRGCESILTERFSENRSKLTCQDVFEAAKDGDEVASRIIGRATKALAAGIAGLLHIFDPKVVILGGQISEAGQSLFEPIRHEVWDRTKRLLGREVPLLETKVSDRSGVVGAAALALLSSSS